MRLRSALIAARLATWISRRLFGHGGGVVGGRVLLRLAPDAPEQLAAGRHLVLVSGTNGKSTVTAMVAAALATTAVTGSNTDGANTRAGLLAALAGSRARSVVLETDEGWLPWAVRRLRPQTVLLLNLSRDQLHRHPEVRSLAASWRDCLALVPTVVANCDDPAITWAAGLAPHPVWVAGGQPWHDDSLVCPACGLLLRWQGVHWSCSCGLARPNPSAPSGLHNVVLHLPGEVNRANAEVAITAAHRLGVPPRRALTAITGLAEVSGRYAEVSIAGRRVRLLLAKNPASWQQALRMVCADAQPVVLAFNAEGVDGRDPSWLYDVDFTPLRGRPLAVTGRRATDLSVRLRIDEVRSMGQFDDVAAAVRRMPHGVVDLVANYTAFWEAHRRVA
jgi:UDP-N-acetylmuramyl tripeptide synthase